MKEIYIHFFSVIPHETRKQEHAKPDSLIPEKKLHKRRLRGQVCQIRISNKCHCNIPVAVKVTLFTIEKNNKFEILNFKL